MTNSNSNVERAQPGYVLHPSSSTPLTVRLLTPDQPPVEMQAESVLLNDSLGQRQIFALHAKLAGCLAAKPITVRQTDGNWREFLPTGGFFQVGENVVTLILDGLS